MLADLAVTDPAAFAALVKVAAAAAGRPAARRGRAPARASLARRARVPPPEGPAPPAASRGAAVARDAERVFVVEGAKVLGEALDAGVAVEAVFVARRVPTTPVVLERRRRRRPRASSSRPA